MKRNAREEGKIKKFTWKMQKSLMVVFCVFLIIISVLVGRVIYLNYAQGERYQKYVLSQQSYVSNVLPYKRGDIVDRNGIVLARSEKVYNIILDPKVLLSDERFYEPTLTALCEIFDFDETEIKSILEDKPSSSYVKIRDKEGFEDVALFKEQQADSKFIKGVWFEEMYIRTYPYNSLASHIIGFTNPGDVGAYGLEQYYNKELNGTNGKEYGYYDSELNLKRNVKPAIDGYSIVSTIDANVQMIVGRKVQAFLETTGAKNIGVVISDVDNGEILAMASNQEFDLNNPRDLEPFFSEEELAQMTEEEKMQENYKIWKNFCVNDTYEPGSTFKNITVAAAMEEAKAENKSSYYCKGFEEIGGWRISCNNRSGHGVLSLAESLMKSCNCAMMEIAASMGSSTFLNYQKHFGFGRTTGIDLPGESQGILIKPENLNSTELATSSFGQRFNITMVQMIAAFSSIVNGGNYYTPHLMKEIRNENGAVVKTADPDPVRSTISKETSKFFREAMYLTVEEGTATPAKVEGYLVGGKTGTGQKLPRDSKKYIVSFVGCAPVDDPKVAIYIVIDEVQDEAVNGSSGPATMLASEIFSEILPALSVYPDGEIEYKVNLQLLLDKQGLVSGSDIISGDDTIAEEDRDPMTVIYNPAEDESNPDVLPEMGETPPEEEFGTFEEEENEFPE